jgi:hypothetical protein
MATRSTQIQVPLLGITFLIFMTLKLCGVIDWSWWWVTAPLWGGFALFLLFIIGYLIVLVAIGLLKK